MANSTRTKWMAQCVSDIFNINEYESLVSTVAQTFGWTVRVRRRFFWHISAGVLHRSPESLTDFK